MKEPSRFLPFPDFFPLFPDFWQLFCCQGWHSAPLATPVATSLPLLTDRAGYTTGVEQHHFGASVSSAGVRTLAVPHNRESPLP